MKATTPRIPLDESARLDDPFAPSCHPAAFRLRHRRRAALAAVLLAWTASSATAAEPAVNGVDMVPADAAFFSASLRLKEQYEMVRDSNAMKAILALPVVKAGLEQLEDQQSMPGSPLSMAATFMELPENQQALELLSDMVSTDTFIYGEASCISFTKLMIALQRANQMASLAQAVSNDFDDLPSDPNEAAARLFFKAVADNVEDLVLPDVVWGFHTTKKAAATQQLARLEVLLKLLTQSSPDLTGSMSREKIDGGELIVLTLAGKLIPWDNFGLDAYSDDPDAVDKVIDKLRSLNLVIGLGLVGDRLVLSIGDSIDHLEKLVLEGGGDGLGSSEPFAPYRKASPTKVTAIGYFSEAFVEAISPTADDIRVFAQFAEPMAAKAELPAEAGVEARQGLEQMADDYAGMLPEPGAWMSYSFMTDTGFAGSSWNWSSNTALDASQTLSILQHVGGSPFAVVASRAAIDPDDIAAIAGWWDKGVAFFEKYVVEKMEEDDREKFQEVRKTFGPLAEDFIDTLRNKFAPALADRQLALVLDDEAKVERLQADLPASADPLPLIEPAIVLGVADADLFKEGLNDLFELSDRLVNTIRAQDPSAIPEGYQIPDPEKTSVTGGMIWSFPIPQAQLDDQIAPAIGLGKDVAVFSLVPGQAGRLLSAADLKTAKGVAEFAKPLGAAAAADVPALIDMIEAWAVYAARYAAVQQREGTVGSDLELSASDEGPMVSPILEQVKVVLEACRCLKSAAAEQTIESGVTITRWRNVIEDMQAR